MAYSHCTRSLHPQYIFTAEKRLVFLNRLPYCITFSPLPTHLCLYEKMTRFPSPSYIRFPSASFAEQHQVQPDLGIASRPRPSVTHKNPAVVALMPTMYSLHTNVRKRFTIVIHSHHVFKRMLDHKVSPSGSRQPYP